MENLQYNTHSTGVANKQPVKDKGITVIDDIIEGFDIRIKYLQDNVRQIVDTVSKLTGEQFVPPPSEPRKEANDGKLQHLRNRIGNLREINEVLERIVDNLRTIV